MTHGKFSLGDRVRVHLYTRQGALIGSIEGVISDFAPDTEVAPGVRKNLVWVTQIQDYARPGENGEPMPADEGWFAEQDIEKVEADEDAGAGSFRLFSN